MTVIIDTRVVRLERVAARTGHQHHGDQRIIETVTGEIVTASNVVSLPPGSLITLQRGPGAGHTEEGSVLNATFDDIGGVTAGQTTSVSFSSEDAGVSAAAIFVVEKEYTASLTTPGDYAINYKTFQIKTYTAVSTTPGSRILISYVWAPIREFLKFNPEDLEPDLTAYGSGPHAGSSGSSNVSAGDGIFINTVDGYQEISVDVNDLYGLGLGVEVGIDGYNNLVLDADASMIQYDDSENTFIIGSTVQEALDSLDGYLQNTSSVARIHKFGEDADNFPFNSVYSLDGYTYEIGKDKLVVSINGLIQNVGIDYTELSTHSIEFFDLLDNDDEVDIIILPNVLGVSATLPEGDFNLQEVYDNSPSGSKNINLDDGQITFTQALATGSVLRLISNSSLTTAFIVDQSGSGEAARVKSVDGTAASLLVQKDATSRNSVLNTVIIDRTTSHASGGQTGIGSAILTRLESAGTNLFSASKIITGTESASDTIEDTFLSIELSNDGVIGEVFRITSLGQVGINTDTPEAFLHVQGDGYFSDDLYVAHKIRPGTDNLEAPINVPILTFNPGVLENGDIWITDIGGTRRFNARIGGTTYSVILT